MSTARAQPTSRLIVLVAALALVALYFVPLWSISLEAPQFPEGIGLLIEIDTIVGQNPHDLQNINGLNHYIGMKEIHPESIPELAWMPWILGVLIGWGVLAAVTGRRWMMCGWLGLLGLAALAGLVDFYAWGYDYGHNLDAERAIIKVPGMTYQPPLIGSKKLLNFTATSLPALGGWIAIAAGLAAGWSCWAERKRRREPGRAGARPAAGVAPGVTPGKAPGVAPGEAPGVAPGKAPAVAPGDPVRGGRSALLLVLLLGAGGVAACADLPERPVDHAAMDHPRPSAARDTPSPEVATAPEPGTPAERAGGVRMPGDPGNHAAHPPRGRATLVVDADGPGFTTIGAAVRAAPGGARILVRPGVYREPTILVDRSLVIEGEGRPVVDGEGRRQLFTVTADDVRITGLVLRDVGVAYVEDRAAIRVDRAARCEIDHNVIRGGFFAVYLARTEGCRVAHNTIDGTGSTETDSGNGIHAWHSSGVVVEGNRVRGHRDGIYFEFVEDGRVSRNDVAGNIRYGLHFMFSDGGRYDHNRFRANGAGVAVMYTADVALTDNRFEDSRGSAAFGLLLKDITDSRVIGNTFRGNAVGLYAEGFDRTRVRDNRFEGNGRAVRLLSNSTGSRFSRNDFVGNTFDVTTNGRHVRSTFAGNHWDAYRGYDLDGDGAGDVPHRPVRLFALAVERAPVATILLRSFVVTLLDWTELLLPSLTPENLLDPAPAMRPVAARP